jgi:molybdopterin molybdotransferase
MAVEAARAAMLAAVTPLAPEEVDLAESLGRVLAEDVLAIRPQPPFASSSMDGWAVRSADGSRARRIIGESAAGRGFDGELRPGEAVRIFTGAPMPSGADAVVIQEDARRDGDLVSVSAVSPGAFVRPAGQDFAVGAPLLTAGMRLDPWRLALAAAAGRARLKVSRRPGVTIISTGDELAAPGDRPGARQIFDSAGPAIAALATLWGAAPVVRLRAEDKVRAIALAAADAGGHFVITIGGASVGDHDLVKPALRELGLRMLVESVAIRPGKPTWFGPLTDGRLALGLPGNPASAMVCAELFLRPLILALQGANPAPRQAWARLAAPLKANGDREHWMRARLAYDDVGETLAQPFGDQDSSLVTVFAEADALLRRPAHAPAVAVGETVEILRLDRL